MEYNDYSYPSAMGDWRPLSSYPSGMGVNQWLHRTGAGAVAEAFYQWPFADTIAWGGHGNLWPAHFPQNQDVRGNAGRYSVGAFGDWSSVQTLADIVPRNTEGSGEVKARWWIYAGAYPNAGMRPIVFKTARTLTLRFNAKAEYSEAGTGTRRTLNIPNATATIVITAGSYGWTGTVAMRAEGQFTRINSDLNIYPGTSVIWSFEPVGVS